MGLLEAGCGLCAAIAPSPLPLESLIFMNLRQNSAQNPGSKGVTGKILQHKELGWNFRKCTGPSGQGKRAGVTMVPPKIG